MFVKVEVQVMYYGDEIIRTSEAKRFKPFLYKKCVSCNEKKFCFYIECDYVDGGYIGLKPNGKFQESETIIKYYCEECETKRKSFLESYKEFQEELTIRKIEQEKKSLKESEEKKRLDYLKKEIERIEIEKKAKLYGIIYPYDSAIEKE